MPVTRFRDVADMPPPPRAGGDDLPPRIRAVWARAARLAGLEPVRGVQRFRSLEEAQRARDDATLRRVEALEDRG